MTAEQATIFWSPDAHTSSVLLERLPGFLSAHGNLHAALLEFDARDDALGTHFAHPAGSRTFHLLRLPGTDDNAPLAALIPLDASGLDRIEATAQLLHALLDRRVGSDGRLTDQQRRRARHMLQAVDGHKQGASYREIAEAVYGVERIRAEHWKTSALRDSVIGLVKGGRAMIAGGYRRLLRHRRKK
ncbi:DUF2285 domain-containing protein [Nitratireductor rhodophyticola]|uniref:DUF2285 domain-containing protein n=1 Tax=Nitratireductor rhodophyticola TaxID=2854036 RepID=UPI003BAC119D